MRKKIRDPVIEATISRRNRAKRKLEAVIFVGKKKRSKELTDCRLYLIGYVAACDELIKSARNIRDREKVKYEKAKAEIFDLIEAKKDLEREKLLSEVLIKNKQ